MVVLNITFSHGKTVLCYLRMLSIGRIYCLGYRNKTAVQYYWYAPINSFPKVRMGEVRMGGAIVTASDC